MLFNVVYWIAGAPRLIAGREVPDGVGAGILMRGFMTASGFTTVPHGPAGRVSAQQKAESREW